MKRKTYGIIAADVTDVEQKELLYGMIQQAQALNIDICILTNIYNPNEPSAVLETENCIYERILSAQFDGLILLSEAIINSQLQKQIRNYLLQVDIPIIAVGTPLPDSKLEKIHYINTDDAHDFAEITNHLIDTHGFHNIHCLTGFDFIDASHQRVSGYRRSLEQHGIAYDESKVFFGDFWLNSGRALASRYLNGSLPFPQALICANDYMAYGVLDACMNAGISIPECFSIIGYEYIRDRMKHAPLLTTFQRNRKELGSEAVRLLTERLQNGYFSDTVLPCGKIIYGNTCTCGVTQRVLMQEIHDTQEAADWNFLNLVCQFEPLLTKCHNIEEFMLCIRDFHFMVQNASDVYLCLYENWYAAGDAPSDNMICYDLFGEKESTIIQKDNFSLLFTGAAAPYYPLSSSLTKRLWLATVCVPPISPPKRKRSIR